MLVYQCKACNKPIVFIKTKAGKFMPCDWAAAPYALDPGGPDTLVTKNGETLKGRFLSAAEPCNIAAGMGYRPHWASCTAPKNFKRGRK